MAKTGRWGLAVNVLASENLCGRVHFDGHSPKWRVLSKFSVQPWKPRPRLLVALKAAFLENYLAVSTWILNGSSTECLKKKYQPFSLAGVRFGSLVNQISELNSKKQHA